MKVVTVVGARPQFIKAAAVSRAIRERDVDDISEVLVHTGQHFDANMSQIFFDELGIPQPDYNLEIFGGGHGVMTGRMLESVEKVLLEERPDWVLVYGDTNSTLAGALAATKLHIPVAHVEAGLRSFNMRMPEEVNRILTDRISALLFCPTAKAVTNLQAEGYPFHLTSNRQQTIEQVGDVMYDVTLYYRNLARQSKILDKLELSDRQYVLCTLHRAENTDDLTRLENILSAMRDISDECPVVLPLHPRTHQLLAKSDKLTWLQGLLVIDPVPYIDMQCLEMGSNTILTDSGGIQKEAFFHRVPCITLREETEWVETVDMGWNRVVGSDPMRILDAYADTQKTGQKTSETFPYGNGDAAYKIVQSLKVFS